MKAIGQDREPADLVDGVPPQPYVDKRAEYYEIRHREQHFRWLVKKTQEPGVSDWTREYSGKEPDFHGLANRKNAYAGWKSIAEVSWLQHQERGALEATRAESRQTTYWASLLYPSELVTWVDARGKVPPPISGERQLQSKAINRFQTEEPSLLRD